MAWYNNFFVTQKQLNEAIDSFKGKGDDSISDREWKKLAGEGIEDVNLLQMWGMQGLMGYNNFFNSYINKAFENEVQRIMEYRNMAAYPEIGDIIEDAANEACQPDYNMNLVSLNILDEKIKSNTNIQKVINREFEKLFFEKIDINDRLWKLFKDFLTDGRIFYERIIDRNNSKKGIINIKQLPAESIDYEINPITGKIMTYYQYLVPNMKRPVNRQEAERLAGDGVTGKDKKLVIFNPEQIGFINYGLYGRNLYELLGYLEKAKVPYNQLKLLETSVIIYRLVRSPQRLVFKIDTGSMPRDKAMKYVERVKQKFIKKQTYDPRTGNLSFEPEVLCIKHDTKIPLLDGRTLTLDDIIKEHNEGKENWVYTVNEKTHNIEPGKIKYATISRPNTEVVRVHLDSGNYIDCTPDHKFILRDGSNCRADELTPGTALMPLYIKNSKMIRGNNEYEKIYDPGKKRWIWTHRMVHGQANNNGKFEKVVHHIDCNRFNNNPENLVTMKIDEHNILHGETTKIYWKNNHDEMAKKLKDGYKIWVSDPENQKRKSEWIIRTNIEQNKVKKMHNILNQPEVRKKQKLAAKQSRIDYFSDPNNRKLLSDKKKFIFNEEMINIICNYGGNYTRNQFCNLLSSDKRMMELFYKLNKNQSISNKQFDRITSITLLKMINHMGFDTYTDFRENFAGYKNHKVLFVEKLSEKSDCGCIEVDGNHNFAVGSHEKPMCFIRNSLLENYYIPTSSDGKGSSIETIGGDAKGFTELDDIYYFSRKLYRALKYPISRITQGAEKGEEVMFGGSGNQIARDEIKWAKFLERQQRIFCDEFLELFLLHLEFRGLKKEYNLDYNSFSINMNPPSHYNEQMEQTFKEQEFANYNQLKDDPAFSKSYLIRKHLKWTDKDFAENKKGFDQDKKYFPQEKVEDTSYLSGMGAPGEAGMMPGGMPGAPGTEDIGFEEEPTEEGTEKEFV